jgi:hypothetical protein
LIDVGLIAVYESGGKTYAEIPSFKQHQVINNRESESIIPSRVIDACVTRESGDQGEGKGREGKGREGKDLKAIVISPAEDPIILIQRPEKPDCPHQSIIDLYHEVLPQCPQIREWTPARQTQLRARWNEDEKRQDMSYWRTFFDYVANCDFLVGRAGKSPFFADLEWLTKSSNFTKIREGKYENRSNA